MCVEWRGKWVRMRLDKGLNRLCKVGSCFGIGPFGVDSPPCPLPLNQGLQIDLVILILILIAIEKGQDD